MENQKPEAGGDVLKKNMKPRDSSDSDKKTVASRLAKIAVTIDADEALEAMLGKVNDGFRGGRVGKQELASWAIMHFARETLDGCLDAIRASHFDEVAYLGAVLHDLKTVAKSGQEPADIGALLAPLLASRSASRTPTSRRPKPVTGPAAATEPRP